MHEAYHFSVTLHSDDLAVINCLRSLAQYSQKVGNNRIPWGGTKDADWHAAGHQVTFRFTSAKFRDGFLSEVERLLPTDLWRVEGTDDNDPAKHQ